MVWLVGAFGGLFSVGLSFGRLLVAFSRLARLRVFSWGLCGGFDMHVFPKVSALALLLSSGVAMAVGPDYSSITSAVDVSTVSTAIIAMGALMVAPNVARWAVRKLAGFFR